MYKAIYLQMKKKHVKSTELYMHAQFALTKCNLHNDYQALTGKVDRKPPSRIKRGQVINQNQFLYLHFCFIIIQYICHLWQEEGKCLVFQSIPTMSMTQMSKSYVFFLII